jgi:phosphoribosylformimino-5-aminoimidazole carboxamide ribotide isomerase
MRLIPAIDLKDGRCVRLLQGRFDAETRYAAAPLELLATYRDLGADWLHVGGGLRSAAALARMLDCGAARVVVGSAAVSQPELVQHWLEQFGGERIVLAFDVRVDDEGTPRVATHGWQRQSDLSLWDAVERFPVGLKHVLCTDVARDGALNGPNVALYQSAVERYPRIEWQASGGVRDSEDLRALARAGASAAISGKALLEQLIPREELQPFLPNA